MNELVYSLAFIPNTKISFGGFQGPGMSYFLSWWARFSTEQGKWADICQCSNQSYHWQWLPTGSFCSEFGISKSSCTITCGSFHRFISHRKEDCLSTQRMLGWLYSVVWRVGIEVVFLRARKIP